VNIIEEFFEIGICIVVWLVPICYRCSEVEHWGKWWCTGKRQKFQWFEKCDKL